MLKNKVRETLRRAAVYTTGWASLAVGVALAQEMPCTGEANAPEGALVVCLNDDPAVERSAARVLRLLQLLGVHYPQDPGRLAVQVEAETVLPLCSAAPAELPQTAAVPVADQDSEPAPTLDEPRAFPGEATPACLASASERTSSWPNADAGDAEAPAPPLACPPGLTSSRRTFPHRPKQPVGSEHPAAQGTAAAAADTPAIAQTSTSSLPTAPPLPVAAAVGASLASQRSSPVASATILPPLPPLRDGQALQTTLAVREDREAAAEAEETRPAEPQPSAAQPSQSGADSRLAMTTDEQATPSGAEPIEPRSTDAPLQARPTPLVKASATASDRNDDKLAKRAVTAALARLDLPPLERKSSVSAEPAVLPQVIAANRRQASTAEDAAPRVAAASTPVNTLRTGNSNAATLMPEPIMPQTPPEPASALARSQTLSPLPSPPQLQTPMSSQTPTSRPDPRGDAPSVAAAHPAPLRVSVRESRLLRTPENVVRVVPEHDRFCDVLVFNPREVAVIGKQQGTVRVELWYDQQGLKRASYLIAVDNDATAVTPETSLSKIEQLIAYLFPASSVELVQHQEHLIVRGSAVSRRQAVEILSTVRRSQLIPVVDEVVVRPEAK
jgi:hypothetical protein